MDGLLFILEGKKENLLRYQVSLDFATLINSLFIK